MYVSFLDVPKRPTKQTYKDGKRDLQKRPTNMKIYKQDLQIWKETYIIARTGDTLWGGYGQ